MARRKNAQPYPHNIEEFVAFGWDKQVMYRIRSFNLFDTLNAKDELQQDIRLALMETGYIQRYDPNKGPFSTYLYGFVDNFLKKRYNKENTRHGKKIVHRSSVAVSSPEANTEFDGGVVYLDLLPSLSKDDSDFDVSILIEEIREELSQYKANSEVVKDGVVYKRDPLTVFNLLLEDKSIIEISELLSVSRQFTYHILKKIRSASIFQELSISKGLRMRGGKKKVAVS